MSIGSFFSNIGSSIGRGIENARLERARRLNNPAFQETLRLSREQFVSHITSTASNGFMGVYRLLLEAPIATTWFAIRGIADDKVKRKHMVTKMFDEFGGAFGSLSRSFLSGVHAVGRGSLHTLRWLTAK